MSNDTPLSPEAEKLSAARKRNLDLALTQIQKDFGENAIMRLGDNAKMEVDVIPTGNLLIDRALGVGGFARGRVVEIYGRNPPVKPPSPSQPSPRPRNPAAWPRSLTWNTPWTRNTPPAWA